MQLSVYVGPNDEDTVLGIKAYAHVHGQSVSQTVYTALDMFLTMGPALKEAEVLATKLGMTPLGLMNAALDEYLTLHQVV